MKKWIAIALTMVLCLSLLAGCGKKEKEEPVTLVGTWEYKELDAAYIFNEDGTGAYRFYGAEMPFTYTDDGESVSILYTGNTSPNVFAYSISGKTLSIEDSYGEMVKYTKAK